MINWLLWKYSKFMTLDEVKSFKRALSTTWQKKNWYDAKVIIYPQFVQICWAVIEKKWKKSPIEESNQNSEMSIAIDSEPLIKQGHEYSCKYWGTC